MNKKDNRDSILPMSSLMSTATSSAGNHVCKIDGTYSELISINTRV